VSYVRATYGTLGAFPGRRAYSRQETLYKVGVGSRITSSATAEGGGLVPFVIGGFRYRQSLWLYALIYPIDGSSLVCFVASMYLMPEPVK